MVAVALMLSATSCWDLLLTPSPWRPPAARAAAEGHEIMQGVLSPEATVYHRSSSLLSCTHFETNLSERESMLFSFVMLIADRRRVGWLTLQWPKSMI